MQLLIVDLKAKTEEEIEKNIILVKNYEDINFFF